MKWEYKAVDFGQKANVGKMLNINAKKGWRLRFCDLDKAIFIFERLNIPIEEVKQEMPEEMKEWQLWKR